MGIQNHHEMKLLAFFICAANAQSFNDKLPESITDDGYCQSVQISATVAEQWNVDRMFVEISVSGWGVVRMLDSAERKARLINDWSRLKFKLKYFNNLIGEYVDISPVDNYDSDQYVDSIDVRNEVWRVLFKDAKSKELSEMGEQRNELRLQTWIAVDSYLAYDDLEKDIVMEVESPQLCDGGYESELVYEVAPDKPVQCVKVNETVLEQSYHRPPHGGATAELFTQAEEGEEIGCRAYIIVGFDAPRTSIDLTNSDAVSSFMPLDFALNDCPTCAESSFWRITFNPDRVRTQYSVNLHIDMLYFGTEEQAPIPYFQYNCDFNLACDATGIPWDGSDVPIDNPSFDDLDKYGCVCAGIKTGVMPKGRPIDAVDRACSAWRKCNKCAGEQCGGYTVNQYQQCTNGANTCQRATCECDMALARAIQTSNEFDSANLNYNSCSNGSSSGSSPGGCCKLGELYQFYNTATHQCCTNGEVALTNQC